MISTLDIGKDVYEIRRDTIDISSLAPDKNMKATYTCKKCDNTMDWKKNPPKCVFDHYEYRDSDEFSVNRWVCSKCYRDLPPEWERKMYDFSSIGRVRQLLGREHYFKNGEPISEKEFNAAPESAKRQGNSA